MNPGYLILAAALLGGCSHTDQNAGNDNLPGVRSDQEAGTTDPVESTRSISNLTQARDQWQNAGPDRYTFIQQRHCYCRREYTLPIMVVVQDGNITSATYEDGKPVSAGVGKTVRTMSGWLDYIATRQLNDPHEFEATFAPQYGYPVHYKVDQRENVADDTEEVFFSAFKALP